MGRTADAVTYVICQVFMILLLLFFIHSSEVYGSEWPKGRICIGTNGRISVPSNRAHHYQNLRDRYINCTYVDGNLELTWLQDENLDLSFLKYIREVTGYVLISHVDVKKVVLPSLQIIRGRTLFKLSLTDDNFALFVMLSRMNSIEMPALRDILHGNVHLFNNYNLCHVRSINWTEIMSDPKAKYFYTYNFSQPQRTCHCHESCDRGCWGEGAENCQIFSKITCSPQCHDGRCYGSGPRDCCHLFCAGGCTGPTQSECLACHNFNDGGECKQECPPMKRYNTITYSWEPNPDGKYAYGATCVQDCPGHLLKDSGACVRSCPDQKKAVNGECVPCVGPCPKTCQGVETVHSSNIDSFSGCTVIEGSLTILDHSFDGYQFVYQNFTFGENIPKMHISKLETFSTLKEVTGYISIQASHPEFTDLSFLRNLEVIGGRETTEYFSSLYIVKTSLKSLGLRSLRRIRSGNVYILENDDLCFAEQINWRKLVNRDNTKSQLLLQNNRKEDLCHSDGFICHDECSEDGCWGLVDDQCLSCRNFKLGDRCINNCSLPGIYATSSKKCSYCHSECKDGCYGESSSHCRSCKNVKDGPFCVAECPRTKFNSNGICQVCHSNCINGCTGAQNNLGYNGCNSCKKALVNDANKVEYCLRSDEPCPSGYFPEWIVRQETGLLSGMAGNTVCRKCHPRCKNCTAYGIHISVCHECMQYRRGENCEERCPEDHYVDEVHHVCLKCSTECSDGCTGPLSSDCKACRNYRIYLKGTPSVNNTEFNCTASCPEQYPYKLFPLDFSDPYCAKEQISAPHDISIPAIVGGSLGVVFVLSMFLLVVCYLWWQRNRSKEEALKMTMTMMPYDDNEPLKPTNIKPNLAKLRIVKEAELRKGGILGYGAFGTVYKGVWVPEGENVKIPVAIKVLRDGTGINVNKEILEEAYIMASVDHPNLLQLLAVCMTTQIMLVTQLMPLGCLLDYVRNNKEKVGSKPLLNWCTQIAKGMHYLEERRLVHRDLAARNVLVQTPNSVKITDFGLAKLLDYNEDEYKAAGGKMPIKWLALECIQHRIFTHKSDVWAFGVTIWEILTYGGRPYEDIPAREVPDLLEKGERLPQPSICTIDVYMLMIRCWMLDAESRPSFRELSEEFAKMSRDPGRFLVIQGDKLMRLPSYTPQDERELIRSLSSAIGGEGVLMPAEEYLHPKSGDLPPPPPSNASHSEPVTPVKGVPPINVCFQDYSSFHSDSPQNQFAPQRQMKHGRIDQADLNGMSKGSSINLGSNGYRYSSDPLKMFDGEMGDDDCFEPGPPTAVDNGPLKCIDERRQPRPGYGWVGNVRLDLPLDDDDYLMPFPQSNGIPTVGPSHQSYMEFMTDETDQRAIGSHHGINGFHGFPSKNGLNKGQWVAMDNPEYHLAHTNGNSHRDALQINHFQDSIRLPANHTSLSHAVGVPVFNPNRFPKLSTSSCSSAQSGIGASLSSHQKAHNNVFHTTLPSSNCVIASKNSDNSHEYYNEMPRIAPTTRSETTV